MYLVFGILGGIWGGIFTPTEASAVAAAYALFIGLFVLKTAYLLKISDCAIGSLGKYAIVG